MLPRIPLSMALLALAYRPLCLTAKYCAAPRPTSKSGSSPHDTTMLEVVMRMFLESSRISNADLLEVNK